MEQKTQQVTYSPAEVEIVLFDTEDVITSSEGGYDAGEGGI